MKKPLRKVMAAALALTLIMSLLAGCGSKDEGTSGDVVTIKFGIHVANPEEQENVTYQIVQAFNEKFEGQYAVEFEASDTETHSKNMKLEAEDGTLPDIFWIDASEAPEYASNGYLLDLSGYLEENADIDTALNGMENAFNNGEMQYGVPYQCNVQGFFYNKEIFDSANVAYPTDDTTYEEFVQMVKDLKAAGTTPISIGSKNSGFAMWEFNEFLARYGWEDMYKDMADGNAKYNNDEIVK